MRFFVLLSETMPDFSFTPVWTWFVPPLVNEFIGQILLRNPSTRIIMRVVVSSAMSKNGGSLIMSIAQMCWYFAYRSILDVGPSPPNG
jgi:hypothetical protein